MSHLVSLGLWEGIGEQNLEMFCSHARFCSLFWGGRGTTFLMTILFLSFLSSCDVVPLLLLLLFLCLWLCFMIGSLVLV